MEILIDLEHLALNETPAFFRSAQLLRQHVAVRAPSALDLAVKYGLPYALTEKILSAMLWSQAEPAPWLESVLGELQEMNVRVRFLFTGKRHLRRQLMEPLYLFQVNEAQITCSNTSEPVELTTYVEDLGPVAWFSRRALALDYANIPYRGWIDTEGDTHYPTSHEVARLDTPADIPAIVWQLRRNLYGIR